MNDNHLVSTLLPQTRSKPSEMFGFPFNNAVALENLEMVKTIVHAVDEIPETDSRMGYRGPSHWDPFSLSEAVDAAISHGNLRILNYLVDYLNTRTTRPSIDKFRDWVDQAVIYRASVDAINALLRVQLDEGFQDSYRRVFPSACSYHHEPILTAAIIKLMDINHQYREKTPLMVAVSLERPEVVKMVLDAGANVNARGDQSPYTALGYALQYRHYMDDDCREERQACIKLLLLYGASDLGIPHTRRSYGVLSKVAFSIKKKYIPSWKEYRNMENKIEFMKERLGR